MQGDETLEDVLGQVERHLIHTFDLTPAAARQHLARWRAEQHLLEGDLLPGLLAMLPREEAVMMTREHADRGDAIADALEKPV